MFIFKMALADDYDFGAQIKIVSYLVSKFLARKVRKIDMVSSLKGNE